MKNVSSEALSDRYLHVNNCGIQLLGDADYHTVRQHGRIDFHMLCIIKGRCKAVINGEIVEAHSGDAILLKPGERHEYSFRKEDRSESLWIHFTGRGCEEYLGELGLLKLSHFYIGSDPTLLSTLESMVTASRLYTANGDICDGYLFLALALMAETVRCGEKVQKNIDDLSDVVKYINGNLSENLSAAEYAAMCCMSRSRFEHIFSETLGMPLRKYIISARIEKAKYLLRNTSLSVCRIGESVGIADANYFSRLFGKIVGETPGKYRDSFGR